MSIKLQDISTTSNLDLTDKVLISDGTAEHLVTVETFLGRMSTLFQGLQASGTQTITTGYTMQKIALVNNGVEVPSGDSGMSIVSGGVKVTAMGSYKITANAYIVPSNVAKNCGIYVFYGSTFTDGDAPDTGATELCGVFDTHSYSSIVQVTGIVMNVPANTIFWLVGRASDATCTAQNGWLLVERLA